MAPPIFSNNNYINTTTTTITTPTYLKDTLRLKAIKISQIHQMLHLENQVIQVLSIKCAIQHINPILKRHPFIHRLLFHVKRSPVKQHRLSSWNSTMPLTLYWCELCITRLWYTQTIHIVFHFINSLPIYWNVICKTGFDILRVINVKILHCT